MVRRALVPHEVIDDQHPPTFKHIVERDGAILSHDHDGLHPSYWQAPARGGQFVAGPRVRFLADQQLSSSPLPFITSNDSGGCRFCHGVLPFIRETYSKN